MGSSRMSSSTSEASAATMATFCRLPLEYWRPRLVGSSSKRSSRSARRCSSRPPRSLPSRSMASPPVSPGHSAHIAGHVGEPAVQRHHVVPRVAAEQLHAAAVGLQQAQQHPDRRGLAGAVRAEEPVHLAALDVQVQAAQRLERSVRLVQAFDADDVHTCTLPVGGALEQGSGIDRGARRKGNHGRAWWRKGRGLPSRRPSGGSPASGSRSPRGRALLGTRPAPLRGWPAVIIEHGGSRPCHRRARGGTTTRSGCSAGNAPSVGNLCPRTYATRLPQRPVA